VYNLGQYAAWGLGSGVMTLPYPTLPCLFPSADSPVQFPSLSQAGVVPEGADISSGLDGLPGGLSFDKLPSSARLLQLSHLQPLAREARVMRYREKKKTRKFEKTIRYAFAQGLRREPPENKGMFV